MVCQKRLELEPDPSGTSPINFHAVWISYRAPFRAKITENSTTAFNDNKLFS